MSVTIRLARFGKKHAPAYRIVVSTTKDKRNGKFLDLIGHYNPSENPIKFEYNKEKLAEWKGKGALVSSAVEKLVEGTYVAAPYDPHKKLMAETAKTAETQTTKE